MLGRKSLLGLLLATIALIPALVLAQPGGAPPSGNVDAQFDSVRIDGDLEFYDPSLGWPFANFTIFSSGDIRDEDSGVQVTDTQGFSVFDDSGVNEWFRIGSSGIISNPSTVNSGKVLLYDPDGVQLSSYFEVSALGAVSNTDPVQNSGRVLIQDPQGMEIQAGTASLSFKDAGGSDIEFETNNDIVMDLNGGSGTLFLDAPGTDGIALNAFGIWSPFDNLNLADNVEISGSAQIGSSFTISSTGNISDSNSAVTIDDDIQLPATTTASSGSIRKGSNPFIHNFGSNSTFLGINAGNLTNSGWANTGVGEFTLQNLTGGYSSTAVGYQALQDMTNSEGNTGIGALAASNTTTGSFNTAVGQSSLFYNTTGNYNAALGQAALWSNTYGYNNVAAGALAMSDNTSGHDNVAVGDQALANNSSGYNNVAIGRQAGYGSTTGIGNVFIGNQAGYFASGSNQLYIDNSSTSSPLIEGNFSSNRVDINGSLYASNLGYYYQTGWTSSSLTISPGSYRSYSVSCSSGDIAVSCDQWRYNYLIVPRYIYSSGNTCYAQAYNGNGSSQYFQLRATCLSPDG